MSQPKDPPLSVRLYAQNRSALEAHIAAIPGAKRNHEVNRLLALGLEAYAAIPKYVVVQRPAPRAAPKPTVEKREPFKTRLKGEWKAP